MGPLAKKPPDAGFPDWDDFSEEVSAPDACSSGGDDFSEDGFEGVSEDVPLPPDSASSSATEHIISSTMPPAIKSRLALVEPDTPFII